MKEKLQKKIIHLLIIVCAAIGLKYLCKALDKYSKQHCLCQQCPTRHICKKNLLIRK